MTGLSPLRKTPQTPVTKSFWNNQNPCHSFKTRLKAGLKLIRFKLAWYSRDSKAVHGLTGRINETGRNTNNQMFIGQPWLFKSISISFLYSLLLSFFKHFSLSQILLYLFIFFSFLLFHFSHTLIVFFNYTKWANSKNLKSWSIVFLARSRLWNPSSRLRLGLSLLSMFLNPFAWSWSVLQVLVSFSFMSIDGFY